ncbi:MAG TPA: hypothetical protein VD962_07815 [Rubricoccaceae bacterium]|nr:hypothetical protein [Rubricoccaceae bacterium]
MTNADVTVYTDTPETSADLRRRLETRAASLKDHIEGLKQELTTPPDFSIAGRPALDYIRSQPFLAAAVALGVGALSGTLLGARARRRRIEAAGSLDEALTRVLENPSVHHLRDDRSSAMVRLLREERPVIVYHPKNVEKSSPIGTALQAAMGFGMKAAMDHLTKKLTGRRELFDAMKEADTKPDPPPTT